MHDNISSQGGRDSASIGGAAVVGISKTDGRILRVSHGKQCGAAVRPVRPRCHSQGDVRWRTTAARVPARRSLISKVAATGGLSLVTARAVRIHASGSRVVSPTSSSYRASSSVRAAGESASRSTVQSLNATPRLRHSAMSASASGPMPGSEARTAMGALYAGVLDGGD